MSCPIRFSLSLAAAVVISILSAAPQMAQVRRGDPPQFRFKQAKSIKPTGVVITAANYQVTQTTGPIVSGTSPVTGFTNTDDATANIALPFPYTLYDQTFTTANISTNGNIQFVSNSTDYGQSDVCFPLPQFNYAILPHWGDLSIAGANEGVFTSVTGSAPNRIFNIEWRTSIIGDTPGGVNFEVRLYEGLMRFDIVFGTAPGGGTEVSVGVQRAQGVTYTEFECHQNAIRSGMMLIFNGDAATSLFIAGRVTDPDGNAIAGATVTLSGNSSSMITTDGTGDYSFTGLTSGGSYTVTPSQAGFSFFPASKVFGGAGNRSFTGNFIVNFIRTTAPVAGTILISEFRFRGDAVANFDEFIEITNNGSQGITVNADDGSAGWRVQTAGGIGFLIPNGTTIPARGKYLAGNGSGYNLFSYANADTFYSGDIPDDAGIALFSTADVAELDLSNRLDAVGFTGETNSIYREGIGLTSPGANNGNYSFVRKLTSGIAQDTDDNVADFEFVSTTGGTFGGVPSKLGAPGPENTAAPIQRNANVKGGLFDTGAASTSAPNRVRDLAAVTNGANGTLTLRRRFTNSTGVPVTRMRFRIVDITTLSGGTVPAGQADIRALNSLDAIVGTSAGPQQVRGLTIEQGTPQITVSQPNGGGLNSSLAAGFITVAQPLAPGATINVEFRLGVQTGGSYRFFVNVEALP